MKTVGLALASAAALAISVAGGALAAERVGGGAGTLSAGSDILGVPLQQSGTVPGGVGALPTTATLGPELWFALALVALVFGSAAAGIAYFRR